MKSCSNPSTGASYTCRADGMRVKRVEGLTLTWNPADEFHASGWYDENQGVNLPTTRYYYDGQMPIEVDFTTYGSESTPTQTTRYGLGTRGVDFVSTQVDSGSETVKFPIYDGHGNMIATLARNGSSYSLANERLYDVWGSVRTGSSSGAPSQRYCANLGHKQDDESGLIYMRARYYEPSTGRFVSEDPARQGGTWYMYAAARPIMLGDADGRIWLSDADLLSLLTRFSVAIVLSHEAYVGAVRYLALCTSWVMVEYFRMPSTDLDIARKTIWTAKFDSAWAQTKPIIGSVGDKAKALADVNSIGLLLVMWVLDDSSWLWKN